LLTWHQIRSIYRVVEFAMGVYGYLFQHEWGLYVFEATPMFIALTVLAWCHPVRWMQEKSLVGVAMREGVKDGGTSSSARALRKWGET
jgi:hypothetical protein